MKKATARKNKIAILLLSIIFVITTVLGLNLYAPRANVTQSDYTLRFKQVALGGDFGLAVSYEGELFVWSLTRRETTFGAQPSDSTTLGAYYPAIPTKIFPDFFGEANGILGEVTYTAANPLKEGGLLPSEDAVKMVAATRYTAAFVSEKGFVYTWGPEFGNATAGGSYSSPTHILLRTNVSPGAGAFYTPTIIKPNHVPGIVNYKYTGSGPFLSTDPLLGGKVNALTAIFDKQGAGAVSGITAAENNFIVWDSSNYGAWGSDMFRQTEGEMSGYGNSHPTLQYERYSFTGTGITPAGMYVGDDYVVVRGGTDGQLHVRGKNFYLNEGSANRPINIDSVLPAAGSGLATNVLDAADMTAFPGVSENTRWIDISLSGEGGGTAATSRYRIPNAMAQSFNAVTGASARAGSDFSFKDKNGNVVPANVQNQSVSAGAGFMYFINSAGNVQMLGNGFAGQASAPSGHYDTVHSIAGISNARQVVAGRVWENFIRAYVPDGNRRFDFRNNGTTNPTPGVLPGIGPQQPGNTIEHQSGTEYNINIGDPHFADFAADTQYISAALTVDGGVYAWNAFKGVTDLNANALALLLGSTTERVVTLAGGYGNILYALTNTGKLIRISYDAEAGSSGEFTAYYHDDFQTAVFSTEGILISSPPVVTAITPRWSSQPTAAAPPAGTPNSHLVGRRTAHFRRSNDAGFTKVSSGDLNPANTIFAAIGIDSVRRSNINFSSSRVVNVGYRIDSYTSLSPTVPPIYSHVGTAIEGNTDHVATSFITRNDTGDPFRLLLDGVKDVNYFRTPASAALFSDSGVLSLHNNNIFGRHDDVNAFSGDFTELTGLPLDTRTYTTPDVSINFYRNYDTSKDLLDRELVSHYFDFEIAVYNSGNGADDIQLYIYPKKSTTGDTITAEFYVGRYNDATRYREETVIYDSAKVALDIVIDTSLPDANKYREPIASNITPFGAPGPLLDVNGTTNRFYSVAAMNVSAGFDTLAADLVRVSSLTDAGAIVSAIHDDLVGNNPSGRAKDLGFPSSNYIAELSYYDSATEQYYNDTYRFFTESRDGSLVRFAGITEAGELYRERIRPTLRDITVEFNLAALFGAANWDEVPAVDKAAIERYLDLGLFNNLYGFYRLRPAANNTEFLDPGVILDRVTGMVSIVYQVVTFEAVWATDSATYSEDDAGRNIINMPQMEKAVSFPSFTPTLAEYSLFKGAANNDYNARQAIRDGRIEGMRDPLQGQFVTLHSHASLRLKDDVTTGAGAVSGNPRFGANVADFAGGSGPSGNVRNVSVGVGGATAINLVDLMQLGAVETERFQFEFTFGHDPVGEDGFYAAFTDSLNNEAVDISRSHLSKHTIRLFFTNAARISFTVGIVKTEKLSGEGFGYRPVPPDIGADIPAEYIELNFIFNATIASGEFRLKDPGPQDNPNSLLEVLRFSDTHTLTLQNFLVTSRIFNPDAGGSEFIVFTSAQVLETTRAAATVSEDGKTIRLTARRSGVTYLRYTISLLGTHTLSGMVQITIDSITEYLPVTSPLRLFRPHNIAISDLTQVLMGRNTHLALSTLIPDLDAGDDGLGNANRAITIQTGIRENNEIEWQTVALRDTNGNFNTFVREASLIEDNAGGSGSLRIVLGSVAQSAELPPTRIVVTFYNGLSGAEKRQLSIAIPVSPGHMAIVGANSVPIMLDLDYNEGVSHNADEVLNEMFEFINNSNDKRLVINKDFFMSFINVQAPENYFISRAFIDDSRVGEHNGDKFFTYNRDTAGRSLSITPLYPTQELAVNDQADGVRFVVDIASNTNRDDSFQISFFIRITGITITLDAATYGIIFAYCGVGVFAFLFLVFVIRYIVYLKRKSNQKRIIKKNQMLIKMRDKMHNSSSTNATAAAARAKMRMNDPKYAKMFDDLRKKKEAETGITLDNSDIAAKADIKTMVTSGKGKASKKKKGGKKSIDELRAELAAKRAALQDVANGVPPGGAAFEYNPDMSMGDHSDITMDQTIMGEAPIFEPTDSFEYNPDMSRESVEDQIKAKLDENGFVDFEPIIGE
ncbi:MAG: hypothetical protein FWH03_04935 [Firmicutes bacterium]|nr:hypothetical protein [Bacillota bacterium]